MMEATLLIIARVLDAVPDGLPLAEVPDWVSAEIVHLGGTAEAATFGGAIVRAMIKARGPR